MRPRMRPRTCRICIFYVCEAAVEGNKCIVWMCLYEGKFCLAFFAYGSDRLYSFCAGEGCFTLLTREVSLLLNIYLFRE